MTTIAFLSLFFGLIRGPLPVELAVNGPVAAVELLVDGKSVQTLQAPPWKTAIDFGPDLLPHEIVARALDAKGAEIARTQEWANLPHSLAKVDILLEMDKLGPPKAARVVWTNLQGQKPTAISLVLDGLPLALDSSGRASLPAQDLASLHVLTAEATFPSLRPVRREIAYGGEYGSEVSTELTAVPVRTRRGDLPPLEKLTGWLTSGGKPLPVAAAEQGPKQLYVIAAPGISQNLSLIASQRRSRWNMADVMQLGMEDRLRFVLPFPRRFTTSGGEQSDIFDISPEIEAHHTGLLSMLVTSRTARSPEGSPMRTAEAAAVAGLEAVTENRRRAILVVLPGGAKEESRFDPAMVRRYLAALRVPLFIWSVGKPEPGSAAAAWGKVVVLKGFWDLQRAYEALRENLDSQRILLVDGRILPQSIALSPVAASRLELAGSVP
ncbi:MAG: hypothetical protein ABIS20_16865 [Thermoanaerobaculia bacterium]